ncbi:MAG: hypothetical protein DRJ05_08455 [Bacteroidetes bacterium]|nr:MAG: hypothetical protein DRJ05_08455 [Bacteroidota bacterium]
MEEPLKYLYKQYGFQKDEIKEVVIGDKYLAVLLKGGNMGVCAILKNEIEGNISEVKKLNLDLPSHRIFYTAWLNAMVNYENDYSDQKDIFDLINFSKYERVVMIGYFKPVAEKLRNAEIDFSIFDLYKQDKEIVPLEMQRGYVKGADAVILTATSIFNNTFRNIVCNTSPGACDIFVLGPSAILSKELLKYRNVKKLFGFVFPKNGEKALQIIREGGGTRSFNKFGSKVYI